MIDMNEFVSSVEGAVLRRLTCCACKREGEREGGREKEGGGEEERAKD